MPNSPRKISQDEFEQVLEHIATSTKSCQKACALVGITYRGLFQYMKDNGVQSVNDYAHAKQEQAEFLANEIIEIADEAVQPGDSAAVNDKRVRIDSRKWIAAHLKPKIYGDQVTINDLSKALPTILKIELVQPKARQQIGTDKQDITGECDVSD